LQARDQIQWAQEYKLINIEHTALGLLFPVAGQGTIGSNAPVATSGSESEFQVGKVFVLCCVEYIWRHFCPGAVHAA
jgi:hypothetical protein